MGNVQDTCCGTGETPTMSVIPSSERGPDPARDGREEADDDLSVSSSASSEDNLNVKSVAFSFQVSFLPMACIKLCCYNVASSSYLCNLQRLCSTEQERKQMKALHLSKQELEQRTILLQARSARMPLLILSTAHHTPIPSGLQIAFLKQTAPNRASPAATARSFFPEASSSGEIQASPVPEQLATCPQTEQTLNLNP